MRAYAFLGDALLPYQRVVVRHLREHAGLPIDDVVQGDLAKLDEIVTREDALLFLCGLPYVRCVDRGLPLRALAAPVSVDHPDDPPGYTSVLLGRGGLTGADLDELTGLTLGINGYDSMSGWVLPVGMGLPLERFVTTRPTGSHRASLDLLIAEEIDAAPIDSMLLATEALHTPAFGALPVLATYGPSPSPPVVVTGDSTDFDASLREALCHLHESVGGRVALSGGRMARFAPMTDADYDVTRACAERAAPSTP
jgi:ABC-type phosphate/phosphonate transport system substrate-binding protein